MRVLLIIWLCMQVIGLIAALGHLARGDYPRAEVRTPAFDVAVVVIAVIVITASCVVLW
jgi:hypothetical protein